jgi:hypothetical protein
VSGRGRSTDDAQLSKFVVFSLLGIGYETYQNIKDQIAKESVQTIFASLGDVPAKITKAYISQSSYWLSFFPYVRDLSALDAP